MVNVKHLTEGPRLYRQSLGYQGPLEVTHAALATGHAAPKDGEGITAQAIDAGRDMLEGGG